MKTTKILIALLLTQAFLANAGAEIFLLKDGARLEGQIAGRTESTLLVKTKYGDLILKQADITKIIKDGSQNAAAKEETEGIELIDSSELADNDASYAFSTVVSEDGSAKIFYFRDREIIATEMLDTNAKFVSMTGKIPDRTFTEYYENGTIKTVKAMKNGKAQGTVISYYQDGTKQIAANYKDGLKNGTFSFYTPAGKLMIQAEYKNDKLNGPKREYNADGSLSKTVWYKDDIQVSAPAEEESAAAMASESIINPDQSQNPGSSETAEQTSAPMTNENTPSSLPAGISPALPAPEHNSANALKKTAETGKKGKSISVKARKVARGTIYSFYVNNRYTGKARLDNNFNVLMIDGNIPNGSAKLYGKNDILQLEFIFNGGEIKTISVFDNEGNETEQYTINEKREAIKAGL